MREIDRLTGPDRARFDDRQAAAAAAAVAPGISHGARYGIDHSTAVGRRRRIMSYVSAGVLMIVLVAFAVAMASQGGDADLRTAAAAKSPGVLQSSGAAVERPGAASSSEARREQPQGKR